jgi:hypothetical protein
MTTEEIEAKAALALAAQGATFVQPLPPGTDPEAVVDGWLEAWRDHQEQGVDFETAEGRVLHVDVNLDNDYRRACDELVGDAAAVTFAGGTGLVWEPMGTGTVTVGATGDGLLLLRTWVNEDEDEDLARAHAAAATGQDVDAEVEVDLPSGVAVVAWSTVRMAELGEHASVEALRRIADLPEPVAVDQITQAQAAGSTDWTDYGYSDVATAVRLPPGRYRVACGEYDEDDGWSCRWARLTPTGPAGPRTATLG